MNNDKKIENILKEHESEHYESIEPQAQGQKEFSGKEEDIKLARLNEKHDDAQHSLQNSRKL